MRSSYRISSASRGAYAAEYRLMCVWAVRAAGSDARDILRLCGLSGAGSPPTVMDSLYALRDDAETTGYAKDLPMPPDPEIEAVFPFMEALRPLLPAAHAALMARHLRLVDGHCHRLRSESWLAMSLYGTKRAAAHARLASECDTGYAALRRWLAGSGETPAVVLAKTG